MKVPFFDLTAQYRELRAEILAAVDGVFAAAAFSGGPFVEAFEEEFAAHAGARHAVGLNSGTSALHLTLVALGVGAGDEVIVPAQTFIATAWAPAYVGAKPVFVDCDPDTWNIAPAAVGRAVTRRTRAIIGVHLYGQPFDLDAVGAIAAERGLPLVEDAAQAHGARHRDRPVGTIGAAGCFSFYPSKNLGAYGEGGALITEDAALAARVRALRNHASTARYHHDELGYNYRMDGVQAAVLRIKLGHLDRWNARRRAVAERYRAGLRHPRVRLRREPEWARSVHHLFVVSVEDPARFRAHLQRAGVETALHYPIPCHLQKAFASLGQGKGHCPVAETHSGRAVSLPLFPEMSDEQVEHVIASVNAY